MFADYRGLKSFGLKEKAEKIGLNIPQFEKYLDERRYQTDVNKDLTEGRKVGVNSTPMFFVNGQTVKGAQPFVAFAKIIDAELASNK
jgi:protein-disulfide isomerase